MTQVSGDMTSGERTLGREDSRARGLSGDLTGYRKTHHKRQTKVWQRAHAICNLYSCYNFALMLQLCTRVTTLHSCYMKNALVFGQSDSSNFFM